MSQFDDATFIMIAIRFALCNSNEYLAHYNKSIDAIEIDLAAGLEDGETLEQGDLESNSEQVCLE